MNADLQKDFDVNELNAGRLWIKGEITEEYGMDLVQQFQHLLNQEDVDEITIFIDSPGGDVDQGFALVDMIDHAKKRGIKVNTVCISASSIASIILFAGTKGRRFCFPSSRIMIHEPYWETEDELADKKTLGWEIGIARRKYIDFCIQYGKVKKDELVKMLSKDYYMSAEQAKKFGWIDKIDCVSA